MQTAVLVAVILIMLIGLAGTFLPIVPGIPLIFLAIAGYGWYEGFHHVSPGYLAVMGGLAILSVLVDYLAGVLGAKYYGSSRAGIWGAFIGGILGIFWGGPLGIVIGPWLGAVVGEYLQLKDIEKALQVGTGTVVGIFAGVVAKVIIGAAMVVSFLIVVF
ncbi:MAG: DUF456 domain-containing protein [Syntrophomonadaceae bacterium]|nr:DUF456 domain-containing protein [Syntrophomonadaceae bacterium]